MKKIGAVLFAAGTLLGSIPASARTHDVRVGNFYYEEAESGAQNPIVVDLGDTIHFRVEEVSYQPHSANVDGQFRSPDLGFREEYTTPALTKPGSFVLYCRSHRNRGHKTTLIVRASASPSSTPSSTSSPGGTQTPGTRVLAAKPTPGGASSAPPAAPAPAGTAAAIPAAPEAVGATEDPRAAPEERPIAGVLGRASDLPWTTSLWLAFLAAVPIFGLAGLALRLDARRRMRP